ncbi:hypothetical protein HKX69_00015 [Streptomyces argyrophyllae]|uniref:Uncharacterized protein n=1 Tax=Streptomyces argyrophylli TaxID=2726118 RepID=A0A6M4PAR9_9ACTN|nr:hypothetical protein [Streptomyces argyrophyllae]QJS08128.1 hypothetical protein HKX69_00015 [Streptomyces argyrophyllae]
MTGPDRPPSADLSITPSARHRHGSGSGQAGVACFASFGESTIKIKYGDFEYALAQLPSVISFEPNG